MNPEFLSGEASASPAVEPLLAGARALADLGVGTGALSARNGLRTTTHANLPLGLLTSQDFVEVADYDPHLDRLLCIGRRDPQTHAGMHALILRAKKEVGAIVMLETGAGAMGKGQGAEAGAKGEGRGAMSVVKRGRTQLESAMNVLEGLRASDAVQMGPFIIVTGRTPEEAIRRAIEVLG